jgi:hypothetical protein
MQGCPGSLPAAADGVAPASVALIKVELANTIAAAMESFMSCVPLGCIPMTRSER